MADDVLVFRDEKLASAAFPVFCDIRRQGKLCDVTLKVGDHKFTAHRIILAGTIPYFNAMFTHDMVESKQNEISMQGIDPNALELLVNYAYIGCVEIDPSNVQSLLVAANFLQLQKVKEGCCDYLKSRLTPKNVLGIRAFADQYMCGALVEGANKYIQKQFPDIMQTEEFLELSKTEILDIVRDDKLNVKSEEQIFDAVITWIKKDEANRKEFLPELMMNVRLPLLTPQYLSDRVAAEDLIKNCLQCRDLLDEARDFLLMPERRPLLQTFKTRPRCSEDTQGLIYAVGGLTSSGDSLSTVEYYNSVTNRWALSEPMNTIRSRVGITVLNGCLYAIGGYDGSERLSTVEMFRPETKKWSRVGSMKRRRSALGAVSLNNRLYVCGGYDGLSSLNSVEMYIPNENRWVMVAPMLRQRSASGVAVLEGKIYTCGGHDGLSIFDTVEVFDPEKDQWAYDVPMLTKRCRLGVAVLNRKLYCAGGYDGSVFLNSVECYNPDTRKWISVKPMNVRRSRVALVACYGKLFAIGGYDGISNLTSVETYDPNSDNWTFVTSMYAHEGGVGVGIIPLDQDPE